MGGGGKIKLPCCHSTATDQVVDKMTKKKITANELFITKCSHDSQS